MTLQNCSEIPINILELGFEGTKVGSSNSGKVKHYGSEEDIYENERTKSLPLVICENQKEFTTLDSKQEFTLKLRAFGKLGYNQSTLTINYGYIKPELQEKLSKVLKLRKKHYKVTFTVNPTLTPLSWEVLGQSEASAKLFEKVYNLKLLDNNLNFHKYCLVSLELRNTTTTTVKLQLKVLIDNNDKDSYHVIDELYSALETRRLIIPLKRISLTSEEIQRAIPGTINRNNGDSNYDNNNSKFWFKQALLDKIKIYWDMVSLLYLFK